jgi:hypothetical protein
MKIMNRIFTGVGAVAAITASFLKNGGYPEGAYFFRGLALGLILSGFILYLYMYFQDKKSKSSSEQASI